MTKGRVLLFLAVTLSLLGCFLTLRIGPKALTWAQILTALAHPDASREADLVLVQVRLPRVVMGVLIGAALAVAGTVMQALTRNPLASPTLTGFNGGASLAILIAMLVSPALGLSAAMFFSFIGGLLGMALVFGICAAAPGGISPARLALAGIMVSATLGGITAGLVNYFQLGFEQMYWTMGGLCAVQWSHVLGGGAVMAVGFLISAALMAHLDALRLGPELAVGLGLQTRPVFIWGLAAATLLAGGAVAVAGPVAFVGLMSPHLARALVGGSYLRVMPLSAALGALMVAWADSLSRLYGQGYYPLGVFLSLFGSLFFLFLTARRKELQHV